MSFSLITAVYGVNKLNYIKSLFHSIIKQNVADVELIIVDQNKTDEVKELCGSFQNRLNIKYVRVDRPGLSNARNKGLEVAKNRIIAFPDDDCEYPDGLLLNVLDFFNATKYDFFIAGLHDTEDGYKLPYSSLTGQREISFSDVFKVANSNSIFHLNNYKVRFDVDFGIGAKYKSCEEFDYVLQLMKNGATGYFNDKIFVLHPDFQKLDKSNMLDKIRINSLGHGVYFRKHLSILWKSALYYLLIAPIGGMIIYSVLLNFKKVKIYQISFVSRGKGFLIYR